MYLDFSVLVGGKGLGIHIGEVGHDWVTRECHFYTLQLLLYERIRETESVIIVK